MQAAQREHIDTVMRVAADGTATPAARRHEQVIRDSWHRCVHEHQLDPTRMQEAVILPSARLREHQDQLEDFLQIARQGLEALYRQVAGLGYVVLLTDARGITVDFIGDLRQDPALRKAGLYLGADWSEQHAGTCGVGTCINTGQALTVHLDDHFDATHIPLTCTTSPVHDSAGRLTAVLDISALRSVQPKESQTLALQLVQLYAERIEHAGFLQRHRGDWILRLAPSPQFLDVDPQWLIALDDQGRVTGHNRRAQLALTQPGEALIGRPFDRLFEARFGELGRFVQAEPSEGRAVLRQGGRELMFLSATPPPVRRASAAHDATIRLPAPLAALSAGDARLDRQIERAARLVNSPISVLITGETGAGKEWFAKALHASGERRERPFVAVNCAAIPESLIESELFGHLPGSFSGAATKGKRGLIPEADGGTLFLDEIGDMPYPLQARLLRVLSEREVLPVGATRPIAVNVRVIAATHAPLESLVRAGRFRDDLYYRLNGAHVALPPLRERRDLGGMIDRMLKGRRLSPDARALLLAHRWPGNLRELRNVLDFAASVRPEGTIEREDLPESLQATPAGLVDDRAEAPMPRHGHGHGIDAPHPVTTAVTPPRLADRPAIEPDDAALLRALRAARWNVSTAARQLGLARMTIYRRMKRAGIVPPNRRDADGGSDGDAG